MPKTIPLRRRSATASRKRSSSSAEPGRSAAPAAEAILQALADAGIPLAAAELAQRLHIGRKEQHAFDACIATLERDGQLLINRKGELCIVAKLDLVTGTVQGHPDGYGFLVPDAGGDDLFLSPHEMRKALHGDRVSAKRVGFDRRGRPEGEIVDVLERANREVVGRIHAERGIWFVEAENRRINQDLLIPPDARGNAQPGQVVVVEIIEPPSAHGEAVARVKEVLGSATDPGIEIEIALRKHALPFEWSATAKRQAGRLPVEVRPADRKGRCDPCGRRDGLPPAAGLPAACAAPLHSNGSACLRSAISISMPGSVALPSTSFTRATASPCALGGSTISTTTTCPGCALPRASGGISRSWLIRRFSASTNQMPRSSWMRPTTSRFARSSTSTISPSGPAAPVEPHALGADAIAVQRLVHFVWRQEQIVAAGIGDEESVSVGMALHCAGDEIQLRDDAKLALAIDQQLAVALERGYAGIESVLLLLADMKSLGELRGRERNACVRERLQDRFGRRCGAASRLSG